MDFLQHYLPAHLPRAYALYKTYHPYLTPFLRFYLLAQSTFYRHIYPLLYPAYTLANNFLHTLTSDTAPDLLTLLLLALILFLSLRVLEYMRRTVIRWIAFAIRLSMWGMVAAVGGYVYYRGVEQSLEDAGWVWGVLQGLEKQGEVVGGEEGGGEGEGG